MILQQDIKMTINFDKNNGLVPAIIQDEKTNKVLMLGYMNQEALDKTQKSGKVTFFSRSRNTIWTKGETSGNYLELKSMTVDCDQDTLLVKASPAGPVCHTGQDTCFNEANSASHSFLSKLEELIKERKTIMPKGSYTTELFAKGINKIAQKVGEEAVEVVIDAMANNKGRVKEESADLLYHLLVLLAHQNIEFSEVVDVLEKRHK
ncbi:MAG: bifunctional phosphoribosyl-AMP cyclohydrolase/phosphoribosyl-ATP diphosphatase HisIE [Calditrichaeota bacterium]|nr:MAG: bifunctional phosphoribosyl-AMP cyclohydrolase/phosphoribosyl-ATP diphosphatase HisIE [Calditrichota bacterium]MBL1205614.1 bifunctional phosphoribosyl-AMP cyclohydrolase/phosphoribosyl-ATP diphosphatase HisIE [Calditrichota bacterium]NOG45442.1 bifunctional phosphoribosyl-AMP cyclohydrolase/phosphoribosyl-ATP diphosphatase HisIE [Calditrichota bacterium]